MVASGSVRERGNQEESESVGRLTFGIKTAPQDISYDEIVAIWREADATPSIEHAWLFDHFSPINGHR